MKEQPLPESADDRLARVDQDVCEQRRMIKELVTAQRGASATQAASSDLSSDNGCLHGAPKLFTSILTPSIEEYLDFVEAEADGATGKVESALCGARDSSWLDIPAAPMALDVIAKWGVGRFGAEIQKGRENSYLRSGVEPAGRLPRSSSTQKSSTRSSMTCLGSTGALRRSDAIGRIVSSGRGRAR